MPNRSDRCSSLLFLLGRNLLWCFGSAHVTQSILPRDTFQNTCHLPISPCPQSRPFRIPWSLNSSQLFCLNPGYATRRLFQRQCFKANSRITLNFHATTQPWRDAWPLSTHKPDLETKCFLGAGKTWTH